ncbi:hypothetical protein ACFL7D_03665 [candidate division KSB1 bacterium]
MKNEQTNQTGHSFELAQHGAYTWVHIDSRTFARQLRGHVITLKELNFVEK